MRCNCAFVSPQIARTRQCHKKGKLQVWNGRGGRCRRRRGRQHTEVILQKKYETSHWLANDARTFRVSKQTSTASGRKGTRSIIPEGIQHTCLRRCSHSKAKTCCFHCEEPLLIDNHTGRRGLYKKATMLRNWFTVECGPQQQQQLHTPPPGWIAASRCRRDEKRERIY